MTQHIGDELKAQLRRLERAGNVPAGQILDVALGRRPSAQDGPATNSEVRKDYSSEIIRHRR